MLKTATIRPYYDVVIVGARCAGAATAMLLARQGAKVLLVDRDEYGSDTLSTHALMRGAVVQLAKWGVLPRIRTAGTPTVTRSVFHYGDVKVPIDIKRSPLVDGLYAPRRTVLDRALVDMAIEAGAEVRFGVSLHDLIATTRDGRIAGAVLRDGEGKTRTIQAGMVIGADGRRSTIAQLVRAEKYHRAQNTCAVVYGYYKGLRQSGYHFYYGDKVAAGTMSTNDGLACTFVAVPPERYRSDMRGRLAEAFPVVLAENDPALADAIDAAELCGRHFGFAGEPGYFRTCQGRGWALVGDAGYFKDPLTAHGITDALRDAELLANAVLAGTDTALVGYQAERDALSMPLFEATDRVASFDWSMDGVQALHMELNTVMRTEVEHLEAKIPFLQEAG